MKITCHGDTTNGGVFRFDQPVWRDPEPATRDDGYEGRPFRTCSYCGCIHPDDLIVALKAGAKLQGADLKYGWPHKFYVDSIPSTNKGALVKKISASGFKSEQAARDDGAKYLKDGFQIQVKSTTAPDHATQTFKETGYFEYAILEPAGDLTHGKWYNDHLKDCNDEQLKTLSGYIKIQVGWEFGHDERGVFYRRACD